MKRQLKAEVLALVESRGKMSRVAVFAHFELVARRFIEQAIAELAEARQLDVTATEVWTARARRAAAAKPRGVPGQTVSDRIRALFPPGVERCASEVFVAIPDVEAKDLRKVMSSLKGRGELENPSKGVWRRAPPRVEKKSVKQQMLDVFEPGKVLTREQVRMALPGCSEDAVTYWLYHLKRDGKLDCLKCRGYWLPGTLPYTPTGFGKGRPRRVLEESRV